MLRAKHLLKDVKFLQGSCFSYGFWIDSIKKILTETGIEGRHAERFIVPLISSRQVKDLVPKEKE